jgi:hypothetical protein
MVAAPVVDVPHDPVALALRRARDYLLSKQSPGGGFCFYRGYYLEEPNLADTWHGVAALTELLRVVPAERDEHAGFVARQAVEPQPFALYYRLRSLLALEVADPAQAEVGRAVAALRVGLPDPARPHLFGAALQRLRCVLWLRRHLGMAGAKEDLAEAMLAMANADGGYGTPSNLPDTEAAIAVLALCGAEPHPATRGFVQSMADPQFGFRLTAASRSPNLETVHAGAAGCRRLGLDVPHAAAATAFVLSCQTGSGGFARTADALPDLALTHMALTVLVRYLGEAPAPSGAVSRAGTAG